MARPKLYLTEEERTAARRAAYRAYNLARRSPQWALAPVIAQANASIRCTPGIGRGIGDGRALVYQAGRPVGYARLW